MKIIAFIFLFLSFQGIIVQKISAQTPVQWLNYNTSNSSLPTNRMTNIVVDENNRKWIATDCSGLVLIDESEWQIFNSTNSELPSNCIMSLAIDNNQDLWLGGSSDSFYLARYNGTDWMIWNANNSPLQYDYVSSIAVDSSNKIWLISNNPINFGTANELFSFDGDTTWNYKLGFISVDGYRKILVAGDSIITATTNYEGRLLVLKSDGSNYEIGNFDGLYISDLKKDNLGNIWIAAGFGGWGSLAMYNGTSFIGYLYVATSIEIDDENNVWIGTQSMPGIDDTTKLIKYDGTNWTEYTAANSPLPIFDLIYDLDFDNDGNLWITTAFSGLYVFNEEGITPVELSSFGAEVFNNGARLNWQTVSEINNKGFEIERLKYLSIEKLINWETIGFIEGKGTTTEQQSYIFIDQNLSAGKYSYRLKQIDFDGSFEYSNEIEVEVGMPVEFSLSQNYPNPFNPATKIKFTIPGISNPLLGGDKGVGFVTLKVYDVLGNEVSTLVNEEKQPGEYELEFDASKLSSGVYLYTLNAGEFASTRKFVLLK